MATPSTDSAGVKQQWSPNYHNRCYARGFIFEKKVIVSFKDIPLKVWGHIFYQLL